MDVKHRVTGAVVLVSLAVIFLPMILERPHQQVDRNLESMPPAPDVPEFVIQEIEAEELPVTQPADPVAILEAAPAPKVVIEEMPIEESVTQTRLEPVHVAPKPAPMPEPKAEPPKPKPAVTSGWVVQIGTFKNRESAFRIRDELKASGLGGFTEDYRNADNQAFVRVFAGPFKRREEAENKQKFLDKKYQVKSLLVSRKP